MEAVAAGDEVAFELVLSAVLAPAHARSVRLELVDADVGDVELDGPSGVETGADQVLHHFLLAVDRDRAAAGQRREVDPVSAAAEAKLDAMVQESFAGEAFADARALEELDRRMLEHARAHAMLDVVAAAVLDDDRVNALEMQQMREQEPRGPRADDADLRAVYCHRPRRAR